jgi:hypothetical protein
VHADGAEGYELGYRVDPADGLISASPVSATGSGYRRSIKPDLAASGGKVFFLPPVAASGAIQFGPASPKGPGVKVASPNAARETFTVGTSVAAALVTRQAARLYDLVEEVTAGTAIYVVSERLLSRLCLSMVRANLSNWPTRVFPLRGRSATAFCCGISRPVVP